MSAQTVVVQSSPFLLEQTVSCLQIFAVLEWFPLSRSDISFSSGDYLTSPLSPLFSTETLMDSTTATAELGWTVYPVSGSSDNSVSQTLPPQRHN